MHVEVVVEVGLHEIVHEASDCRSLLARACSVLVFYLGSPHVCRSELCLSLVCEDRLLDLDAYGSDDALADVLRVKVFLRICLEELLEGL